MTDTNTLLLAVTQDFSVQIGLPPQNLLDRYKDRALFVGKVNNISKLACSPDGELFCIRDGDLYRGPMPSKIDVDWFTVARRVGRAEWNRVKLMAFHPNGDLYVITNEGDLYKGPQPDNENVSWIFDQAIKIGVGDWLEYEIVFFDPVGQLCAVGNDTFYRGAPPTGGNVAWQNTVIERFYWDRLSHFMGFTPDNKLWAVDKHNGNIYRGDTPTTQQPDYLINADYLGWGYNQYRFLAFIIDKKIKKVISLEFLTDQGEKTSETPEILEEKIYDNKNSSSVLRETFTINKSKMETSSFTNNCGFTFEDGAETIEGGIPCIAEGSAGIRLNTSTTHNWSFTKTNETKASFQLSKNVEVEPGKAIRMVASVLKAKITVPYKAKARTMFGAEVEVTGTWIGVSYCNLIVTQEDYK